MANRKALPYGAGGAAATTPLRQISPLNPLSRPTIASHVSAAAASSTSSAAGRTHLANLDRILQSTHPHHPLPHLIPDLPISPPAPDPPSPMMHGGILHALNLPSLLPAPPPRRFGQSNEEAMSPRSLAHLQRVLSISSPRASPRGSIASRWRDLHGRRAWSGLLDPLDPDLRRELLRYGDLVRAAYNAFHSNPSASASGRHRQLVLPDRAYRPVASLYATSSMEVPNWARPVAPQWMSQRTSWVGFVAVCDSEPEIRRTGRRDIVVALRGTATCLEWAENLRAGLVPIDPDAKVECGFRSLFTTAPEGGASLAEAVVAEVTRVVERYAGEDLSISIAGHSLGAALALLAADELSARITGGGGCPPIAVYSFGAPRVGNRAFADRLARRGVSALRVVNAGDVVTRVPANFVFSGDGDGGYADVGVELKVDSKESPFLRPDADPACCHDLEAYLHLVDGFVGGGSPFRPTARRSLARLVEQQGHNVKRLYVSTAKRVMEIGAAAAGDSAASPSPETMMSRSPSGYLLSPSTSLAEPSGLKWGGPKTPNPPIRPIEAPYCGSIEKKLQWQQKI